MIILLLLLLATVCEAIEVKSKKDNSFTYNLKRAGAKLKINSFPQGAEVYINGKNTGLTTPAVTSLDAKSYTIGLNKEGFEPLGNIWNTESGGEGKCDLDLANNKTNVDKDLWKIDILSNDEGKLYSLFGNMLN